MTFEWWAPRALPPAAIDAPRAVPRGALAILEYDDAADEFRQHYFDSRGVTRLYRMTLSGSQWTLLRTRARTLTARLRATLHRDDRRRRQVCRGPVGAVPRRRDHVGARLRRPARAPTLSVWVVFSPWSGSSSSTTGGSRGRPGACLETTTAAGGWFETLERLVPRLLRNQRSLRWLPQPPRGLETTSADGGEYSEVAVTGGAGQGRGAGDRRTDDARHGDGQAAGGDRRDGAVVDDRVDRGDGRDDAPSSRSRGPGPRGYVDHLSVLLDHHLRLGAAGEDRGGQRRGPDRVGAAVVHPSTYRARCGPRCRRGVRRHAGRRDGAR